MKVLLLGGTGILSTDFTRKLLDEENEVYILNRGRRNSFIDPRAILIKADIRNESIDDLQSKINGHSFDVIVDYLSFNPSHLKKNLSIFMGRFQQYFFISSATAYIKDDDGLISETNNTVGNKNWTYSYNKALCEEFIKETNINYTIVRPYVTYGESRLPFQLIPDGYHFTLIERIKNNKPIALLDGGSAICTLTSTIDFANILYRLLLNPKAYKQDFHITSQYQQTWKEVYEEYCSILNREPYFVSVSLDDIKKYLPEFYQILKGDKATSWRFDNSKVLDVIGGYTYRIDLVTGLKKSVGYFLTHPEMQGIDYKWDGKIDYMIRKVSGIKDLPVIESNCKNSNNRIDYYLMMNPISHFVCNSLWHLKHNI